MTLSTVERILYYSHVMVIISPYCLVIGATDEEASSQLQTHHFTTVSMEGPDQPSSKAVPHLG